MSPRRALTPASEDDPTALGDTFVSANVGANQLQALLNNVSQSIRDPSSVSSNETIVISRPSMRRPYAVTAASVASNGDPLSVSEKKLLLFIADPEAGKPPPADLIRRLYGLTDAESRLTSLLVEGLELAKAAERLQVKKETVRS